MENSERDGNIRLPYLLPEKPQAKQQNHTWSNGLVQNFGKKYVKAMYCHHACLTSMQSTSCEILGWMNHKLESRLLGEISTTSDMQMIPL